MLRPPTAAPVRLLALSCACPGLLAQGEGATAALAASAARQVVPIHAASDGDPAYGVWGAGGRYKASFHDGATFVPMLGRDYPHNQPLGWRTVSVRLGAEELVRHAPRLSYTDRRAEFALGDVVEAYDLRADGLEQTFVLHERVAVGDLVIRGAVTTALSAASRPAAHAPVAFRDGAGRELVVYGAATAVAADGATRAMTTAWDGEQITLRLDGAWLADAAFPVVVDPLLGAGAWVTTANAIGDVDVVRASEGANNAVWMAYSAYASSVDGDVFLQRLNDDGTIGAMAFQRTSTYKSSERPRVAYVAGADRAVVVFDDLDAFAPVRKVLYHVHERSDLTSNTNLMVLPAASANGWRPDVGGTEFDLQGTEALIVWQLEDPGGPFVEAADTQVQAQLLDLVTGATSPAVGLGVNLLYDNERARVTKVSSGAFNNRWAVVWQRVLRGNPFETWDTVARLFYPNNSLSNTMTVFGSSSSHEMAPHIAGGDDRYLVACTSQSVGIPPSVPTTALGTQLRVARVDWPALQPVGSQPYAAELLGTATSPALELGGVAYDRDTDSHWGVSWRDGGAPALRLATVGFRGKLLQSEVVYAAPLFTSVAPGSVSFNGQNGQFVIGYGVGSIFSDYAVIDRFRFPLAFPWSASGTSCSPATIEWDGEQRIGGEFEKVRVSGAAVDSIHLVALSYESAALPLAGIAPFGAGCWLNVSSLPGDLIGLFPLVTGAAIEHELPLPEFLPSDILRFQDFHTVGNGNFDMVTTQRLTVPIAR